MPIIEILKPELRPYSGYRVPLDGHGLWVWCHRCLGFGQTRVQFSFHGKDWVVCAVCEGEGRLKRLRYPRKWSEPPFFQLAKVHNPTASAFDVR